jgi:hypothetical protein
VNGFRVVCPNCHARFDLAADAVAATPQGKIAYVICPQCNAKRQASAFVEEREWDRRTEESRIAEERKRLYREHRLRTKEADLEKKQVQAETERAERKADLKTRQVLTETERSEVEAELAAIEAARNRLLIVEPPHGGWRGLIGWASFASFTCLIAVGICLFAGCGLILKQIVSGDRVLDAIAYGIGLYFIASALFMASVVFGFLYVGEQRRIGTRSDFAIADAFSRERRLGRRRRFLGIKQWNLRRKARKIGSVTPADANTPNARPLR